jgi:tetratricopeptide (TPR) repeat protein
MPAPVETVPVVAEAAAVPVGVAPSEEQVPESVAESVPMPPPPQRPALRQTGMLGGDKDELAVQRARDMLGRGGLDVAMSEYTKLIKKGKLLEEVIYDLQEAVYSHPVDVIVWQTLGDAFVRSNRLQDALDAYSKAEELLW